MKANISLDSRLGHRLLLCSDSPAQDSDMRSLLTWKHSLATPIFHHDKTSGQQKPGVFDTQLLYPTTGPLVTSIACGLAMVFCLLQTQPVQDFWRHSSTLDTVTFSEPLVEWICAGSTRPSQRSICATRKRGVSARSVSCLLAS